MGSISWAGRENRTAAISVTPMNLRIISQHIVFRAQAVTGCKEPNVKDHILLENTQKRLEPRRIVLGFVHSGIGNRERW
jgi:hypothetical protein